MTTMPSFRTLETLLQLKWPHGNAAHAIICRATRRMEKRMRIIRDEKMMCVGGIETMVDSVVRGRVNRALDRIIAVLEQANNAGAKNADGTAPH
jgi:hypothetical protein